MRKIRLYFLISVCIITYQSFLNVDLTFSNQQYYLLSSAGTIDNKKIIYPYYQAEDMHTLCAKILEYNNQVHNKQSLFLSSEVQSCTNQLGIENQLSHYLSDFIALSYNMY